MSRIRCILSLLIMALSAGLMQAETHYRPRVWIGGRAGADISRIEFSPHVKQSWHPGYEASVAVRYAEENLFGLVAELGFTRRGWRQNYEKLPLKYDRSLSYVKLPVMTHINFGTRRFKGFVNLGPEVAFLIDEQTSSNFDFEHPDKVTDLPAGKPTEQLYTPVANKIDYGITAGLGLEYYVIPRNSITIEARLYYGLGNIYPASKADTFGASRNMTIELTLGYFFLLK